LSKIALAVLQAIAKAIALQFFKQLALTGVGRNKAFRAQARISVSGILYECAGNATTRSALRQAQDRLGWSYSGLRLLLVIDASSESRLKNLKIDI